MSEDIFNVNLDEVEQMKDRSAIKPGVQRIRVTKVETGNSPNTGTPYLEFSHDYVNVDGLQAITPGAVAQNGIRRRLFLTQKALPFLRQFVEAHNVTWEEFKGNRDPQQFVGLEADARIDLKPNPDTGNSFNEIGRYIVSNSVTA